LGYLLQVHDLRPLAHLPNLLIIHLAMMGRDTEIPAEIKRKVKVSK
jgi:hypothetical protein